MKLGLKGNQKKVDINGVGSTSLQNRGIINVPIYSNNEFSTSVEAVLIPQITTQQTMRWIYTSSWPIPNNIQPADPEFFESEGVDMLLGAEIYSALISFGQIKMFSELSVLQSSILVVGKSFNKTAIRHFAESAHMF